MSDFLEKAENYQLSLRIEHILRKISGVEKSIAPEIRKNPFCYIDNAFNYIFDSNVQNDIRNFKIRYERCKNSTMDKLVDTLSFEFVEKAIKEFNNIVDKTIIMED